MSEADGKINVPNLEINMDPFVKRVLEFIYVTVQCAKRVAVANAFKELAKPLWGHYENPIGPYDSEEIVIPLFFRKAELVC